MHKALQDLGHNNKWAQSLLHSVQCFLICHHLKVTVHLYKALHFRNSFQYHLLYFKLRLQIILIRIIYCLSSLIFSNSTCPKHEHRIMSTL